MTEDDKIKTTTLEENNAQVIFNYLKEIENKRKVFEHRWIWELIQNACDANDDSSKLSICISYENNKLIFKHTGRRFTHKEVCHLIFMGSTKTKGEIGQFGTGFLVTHLLSRTINVKGTRDDGVPFSFELNRNGTDAEKIKKIMNETWESYNQSINTVEPSEYNAIYEYPLDDKTRNTAIEGINALKEMAPFILVYNPKIYSIEIDDEDKIIFSNSNPLNDNNYPNHSIIVERVNGEEKDKHIVFSKKDGSIEVAIKGRITETGKCEIDDHSSFPKLFYAFPLYGTQEISLPCIINSLEFKPTEKRDSVFLGDAPEEDNEHNKEILNNASYIIIALLSDCQKFKNIHNLLKLNKPSEKEWLDVEWYVNFLKELINGFQKIKFIKNVESEPFPYENIYIPNLKSEEFNTHFLFSFWEICNSFVEYRERLISKDLVFDWVSINEKWSTLGINVSKYELHLDDISEEIEKYSTFEGLQNAIIDGNDTLKVLNDFFQILLDTHNSDIIADKKLFPNQNKNLNFLVNLYKDGNINPVLKEISKLLDIDVCKDLLHSSIIEKIQTKCHVKSEEDVLHSLLEDIKKKYDTNNLSRYHEPNLQLFQWLMNQEKFNRLINYPMKTISTEYLELSSERDEKPLCPKEIWYDEQDAYVDLFPSEFIIDSSYYSRISDEDKWKELENLNLIILNPIIKISERIKSYQLAALNANEQEEINVDDEHESIEKLEISDIAFLKLKDKGVIDTVRKSKEKSIKMIRFLFNYISEEDDSWKNPITFKCKCDKDHKIIPSYWLETLKNRAWIPSLSYEDGKTKKRSLQLTSSTLADILGKNDTLKDCLKGNNVAKLLSRFGISFTDLTLQTLNENEKIELDIAMGKVLEKLKGDSNTLERIGELLEVDSNTFVEEIDKKIKDKKTTERNKEIGKKVEHIIKQIISSEGINITRNPIGSDYLIEHDFIIPPDEIMFKLTDGKKLKLYIEIKATDKDFVRMTVTQGKKAKSNPHNFALCVVPIDRDNILKEDFKEEDVKKEAILVTDIGVKLSEIVDEIEQFKNDKSKLTISGDISLELVKGDPKIKIKKDIWENGTSLSGLISLLKSK